MISFSQVVDHNLCTESSETTIIVMVDEQPIRRFSYCSASFSLLGNSGIRMRNGTLLPARSAILSPTRIDGGPVPIAPCFVVKNLRPCIPINTANPNLVGSAGSYL